MTTVILIAKAAFRPVTDSESASKPRRKSGVTPTQLALPVALPELVEAPAALPSPNIPPSRSLQKMDDLAATIGHFRDLAVRAEQVRRQGLLKRLKGFGKATGKLSRISLVIPVDAQAPNPNAAIVSLTTQEYGDLEIIVVSSVSLDISGATHLLVQPGDAIGDLLAQGFARATGEIIGWMDADTVSLPGALDRIAGYFVKYPARDWVSFGLAANIKGWLLAAPWAGSLTAKSVIQGGTPLNHNGVFFRRLSYDLAGGFPALREPVDDADAVEAAEMALWSLLAQNSSLRTVDSHVAIFRAAPLSEEDEEEIDAEGSTWRDLFTDPPPFAFPPDLPEATPQRDDTIPASPPRDPVSGALPDRLLFSTPDTRDGTAGLHQIWYFGASHTVAMAPVLGRPEIRRLFATLRAPGELVAVEPAPDEPSPWRGWRFGSLISTAGLLGFALDPGFLQRLLRLPPAKWLARRWGAADWRDPLPRDLLATASGLLPVDRKNPVMLEIGCHTGAVLDAFAAVGWRCCGTEFNPVAAEAARGKGHVVWESLPEDAAQIIPAEAQADLVILGPILAKLADPIALIRNLLPVLKPDGLLLLATPNIDSAQAHLFGPTWAHWHPPHHRVLFSRKALKQMARTLRLRPLRWRSRSSPLWSWPSIRLNETGLGGVMPPGLSPDESSRPATEALVLASRLAADWRGQGDMLYAAFGRKQ